jgi:uncharacterized membrane protein YbhN (UPF0104 family)
MIVAGAPAAPPIFRWILHIIKIGRAYPQAVAMLDHIRPRVLFSGWIGMVVGWLFQGLALWATLRGMGLNDLELGTNLPLLTAAVALAIVAGFAALIPAGFGVREWVLTQLLPQVPAIAKLQHPDAAAVLSATVLRLITLVAELGISGILYLVTPTPPQQPKPTHPVREP